MVTQPLRPEDPRTIGSYRLLGRLGGGGMGQVFLGRSPGGRPVAVKLVLPGLAADADFRRRFAQEVDAARRVGGFHTAQVVDASPDADPPWLVTAYVAGPSLQDAVDAHGPLPVKTVLSLGAGLAEGLAAIHACGLVHRDLKPGNVILATDGPRIIDFGISRAVDSTTMTAAGSVIGTPGFMSPEQAAGERDLGPASDVFALGSVLTFAVTGEGPFDAGSVPAVVYKIVSTDPDLRSVPRPLQEVISSCLAKDPAARPTVPDVLRTLSASADTGDNWLPPSVTAMIAERDIATGTEPPAPAYGTPTDPPLTPPPFAAASYGTPPPNTFSATPAPGTPASGAFSGTPAPGSPDPYGAPASSAYSGTPAPGSSDPFGAPPVNTPPPLPPAPPSDVPPFPGASGPFGGSPGPFSTTPPPFPAPGFGPTSGGGYPGGGAYAMGPAVGANGMAPGFQTQPGGPSNQGRTLAVVGALVFGLVILAAVGIVTVRATSGDDSEPSAGGEIRSSASTGSEPSPAGTGARPGPAAAVVGAWQGTYVCNQGLTNLRLTIGRSADGVQAIFRFSAHPSNPSVPSGAFAMTGAYQGGVLRLDRSRWISRPTGYEMVDLRAQVTGDRPDVINGRVSDSSGLCSTFSVKRV